MKKVKISMMVALAVFLMSGIINAKPKPNKSGYYNTGCVIRNKKIAFINVKVYLICHSTKTIPASVTPSNMIQADVDKKFAFKMLRDVDSAKIKKAINNAYKLNGYNNSTKYKALWSRVSGELTEGKWTTITYNSKSKKTCINGACQSGTDIMQATWKLWFGKISERHIPRSLLRKAK